jgi:tetratricopeptide (TPR) repeat protein
MFLNIHHPRGTRRLALLLLLLGVASRVSAQACPPGTGSAATAGWEAYRAGRITEAGHRFREALRDCAANLDAASGIGYVALRSGRIGEADSVFRSIVTRDSLNSDGWTGLALAARRRGDREGALAAARHALGIDPANASAREVLDALDPDWTRTAVEVRRSAALQLTSRVAGERFEVRAGAAWRPLWIKGVNLGVALPGRFPAEFPADSARYAGWLDTLAGMNANTIRVYTILPPPFYRALKAWNAAHPERTLWLVQGVWAELPPADDFLDPAWNDAFRAELRRAADLLHGSASIPPRPGHASGRYDADVSPWTLAYIIGREWEPYAVKAFAARHPGVTPFRGRFLESDGAPALDRWLAEQCDHLLGYEFDRYHTLRPIAYSSWPTLDPLTHPTEANSGEEREWRRKAGRPAGGRTLEYENDAVALDPGLIRATAANPAGWFASYHAYPYYPDFMVNDPGYSQARSSEGRSNYFGYLQELRRHHAGMPLLIAEYGVPSSRGTAHLQPQGWHHGGHDEQAMAAIDARLTRELYEAGAAGGIVFAWLDEWFKRNWLVMDFEVPAEHTRLWHNVMDAEQHYGIMGAFAGDPATRPLLGGDPARWLAGDSVDAALVVSADASYLYLALRVDPTFSWTTHGIEIGIDTHLRTTGQHRLPRSGVVGPSGFEFLLDLPSIDSGALRVLPEYNRYAARTDAAEGDDRGRFLRRPVGIADRRDGRFDPLFVYTNRARFGRDGAFFPAQGVDRGRLRHGTEASSTLSDWYYDLRARLVEVRLSWDLINVTDPSTRTLLFERRSQGEHGTVTAEAFHFVSAVYPRGGGGRPRVTTSGPWRWNGWTEPVWHTRLKPVYDSLKATWGAIP